VLVVASLPWREIGSSNGGTEPYFLGGWCYAPGSCVDYGDRGAPLRDVFPLTFGLVLTALALSVVELILLVGAMFVKMRGLGILVTGILGSVALLAAPIRLYFGLSGSQYSGSYAYNGVSYTWREGPGWFLAFFCRRFLPHSNGCRFLHCTGCHAPRNRASVPALTQGPILHGFNAGGGGRTLVAEDRS